MTTAKRQNLINEVAKSNGQLVSYLHFPDTQFQAEVTRLIVTLQTFQATEKSPHIEDVSEDDERE